MGIGLCNHLFPSRRYIVKRVGDFYYTQCGKFEILLFLGRNYVKSTFSMCKLVQWFDFTKYYSDESEFLFFSTLCFDLLYYILYFSCRKTANFVQTQSLTYLPLIWRQNLKSLSFSRKISCNLLLKQQLRFRFLMNWMQEKTIQTLHEKIKVVIAKVALFFMGRCAVCK